MRMTARMCGSHASARNPADTLRGYPSAKIAPSAPRYLLPAIRYLLPAIPLTLRLFHRVPFAGREEEIFFEAMLAGVKVVVPAAQCVQGGMRPALDNPSALDHQNLIRSANRRQSVRDHKRRPPLHQVTQTVLDHRFRLRIQRRRRLIENQN